MSKKIIIGIAGLGTVGSGLVEMLHKNREDILRRTGREFVIKAVAVHNINKKRDLPEGTVLTADPLDLARDPDIQIVVELMGGTGAARQLILAAMENGKSVVTANKALLAKAGYAVEDINSFETLKAVAEDITARSAELGFAAFSSAGMDSSSDWRFKTHLANLPIYFEYQADGIGTTTAIKGTYLDNYRQIWDLYINNSTCAPAELSAKTGDDSRNEFLNGEAVFFQNGSWEYGNLKGTFTDETVFTNVYRGDEYEFLVSELSWEPKGKDGNFEWTLDFDGDEFTFEGTLHTTKDSLSITLDEMEIDGMTMGISYTLGDYKAPSIKMGTTLAFADMDESDMEDLAELIEENGEAWAEMMEDDYEDVLDFLYYMF